MERVSRFLIPVLVTGMLATGTANTLLTKFQDQVCVKNCDDPDPRTHRHFEQPVIQTLQMFIGEMGCWLVLGGFSAYRYWKESRNGYEPVPDSVDEHDDNGNPIIKAVTPHHPDAKKLVGSKVFLLALPACCDIIGTTLLNVGLILIAASIYQMTRGALCFFVAIFSVVFLKRKLLLFHWLALAIVVLGVAVVGLAGALEHKIPQIPDPSTLEVAKPNLALRTVIGVVLTAFAQTFLATQFVLEEWILENYSLEPLKVVGWEGIFGFSVTAIGMTVMHLLVGSTEAGRGGVFDATEGWRQVSNYPPVAYTSLAIMVSIGGFNFFGISVTRSISATARSIIDTCRTLFIWMISLGLGWESFKWLQVVGFGLLVYGTFLFNELVRPPLQACMPSKDEVREELLPEEPVEHI
ncbi:hypothetical protein BJ508DRAFT_369761 [Ascobolus immersus RN42]|uniref:Integral membrane protein n=1 Tax=Ascobolus immersus RN42 TaxID=1160509 RepID=A0A3N4IBK8_ASCIM|nr:hypothetical protein BJ508DRAFT_369761 [Ascobolus immersus RN42]